MRQVTHPPSCSNLLPHSGQNLASFASAGEMFCFTFSRAEGAAAGTEVPFSLWVARITFSKALAMASGQEVTGTPGWRRQGVSPSVRPEIDEFG